MRRVAIGLAALSLAALPAGWVVSDRLESNDAFCVSCHLPAGRPLHERKLDDFRSSPPQSLVAAHAAARSEFRCIDCHGGTSPLGRVRVKAVAARDALRYLAGRFEEPDHMRHPLWDEDCARCHTSYRAERDDSFHALEVHNVDFPLACVSCHRSHVAGRAELDFLLPEVVLPACRGCHEEF